MLLGALKGQVTDTYLPFKKKVLSYVSEDAIVFR
jgi:hypothetical protein